MEKKKEDLNAVHRQADRLSKNGAAKAVEPTLIQLSKRWRDIESKFAQFRRLNYAQIVSCYWQTYMFATANRILLTMRVLGAMSTLLIKKNLLSASGRNFIFQYERACVSFCSKNTLKIDQRQKT